MVSPPETMAPMLKDQDNPLGQKTNSSTATRTAPKQGLKCPRCDSANTKFCYYNNYSLTQPRHFCKTCRRYWTNGGALRNVAIGGGCRKNKRAKPYSSSSSSSCEFNFQDLSVPFNVDGLPFPPNTPTPTNIFTHFPSFHNGSSVSVANNVLSGFQLETSSAASNSLMGLVSPSPDLCGPGRARSSAITDQLTSAMQSMLPMINGNTTLASSIESLSNINLDLHLKLQQQRLAMMYGEGDQKNDDDSVNVLQQPVNLFQNLEISKTQNLPAGSSFNQGSSGATTVTGTIPTEWFFGNSFPSVTHSAAASNVNGNGNGINDANNNWGGALSWGDFQHQQYSALP